MLMVYVDARKTNMKKKLHKHPKESHPLPHYDPHPIQLNTYDILSFGAKGNGVSDDSEVIKSIQNLKIKMCFKTRLR
jgi:galacturan 1,4-alpha-galacturonidase